LVHFIRRAASRADCTAGSSSATRTPMMAITTSNSTNVKPARFRLLACNIAQLPLHAPGQWDVRAGRNSPWRHSTALPPGERYAECLEPIPQQRLQN
jgi:hypothetical protein